MCVLARLQIGWGYVKGSLWFDVFTSIPVFQLLRVRQLAAVVRVSSADPALWLSTRFLRQSRERERESERERARERERER